MCVTHCLQLRQGSIRENNTSFASTMGDEGDAVVQFMEITGADHGEAVSLLEVQG